MVHSGLPLRLVASCALAAVGCATPVGVRRVDPQTVHRRLTGNVLSNGQLSQATTNVLYRRDLIEQFDAQPARALANLHTEVVAQRENRDDVFALAELSFYHGQESDNRAYYLATALYAWAFLFPEAGHAPPSPFDPRFRQAVDLYNRGLSEGLATGENGAIELSSGPRALPWGAIDVDFAPASLVWGNRRLTRFSSVADVDVRGLPTRYRAPGLGASLAAQTEPLDSQRGYDDFVLPWAEVTATAVLRLEQPRRQLGSERLHATLDLRTTDRASTIDVDGAQVPIEVETTGSLAQTLGEAPIWQQEIAGFLEDTGVIGEASRLAALTPYRPGRVPVIFVHGTASSAGRWAQVMNELMNDPRFSDRVSFWLFSYNTGNPILYSASLLRDALAAAVTRLDPSGRDPALRQMVVIGHSQGGLLTKLTAVDSSDAFWRNISRTPFDQIAVAPELRDRVRRAVFVRPLRFVKRLIFVATPHRGSYFAGNWLSHWIARFITMPLDVTHFAADLLLRNREHSEFTNLGGRFATAIDNMTPGSPFAKVLSSLPIAPGVTGHSIIPVQGDGPAEDGDDGVVKYRSAHVDGLASELVVRSGHSCQDNPHTIEEIRRILALHLGIVP